VEDRSEILAEWGCVGGAELLQVRCGLRRGKTPIGSHTSHNVSERERLTRNDHDNEDIT
jgi:hypothetical protein